MRSELVNSHNQPGPTQRGLGPRDSAKKPCVLICKFHNTVSTKLAEAERPLPVWPGGPSSVPRAPVLTVCHCRENHTLPGSLEAPKPGRTEARVCCSREAPGLQAPCCSSWVDRAPSLSLTLFHTRSRCLSAGTVCPSSGLRRAEGTRNPRLPRA